MAQLDERQWDFVCYVDQYWRENECFPSDSEIRDGTGVSEKELPSFLADELVLKNLEVRGIDPFKDRPDSVTGKPADRRKGNLSRLSDIQLATVSVLLNPADRRSRTEKLSDLGVTPTQFSGWKKNRIFANYMKKQSNALLSEWMPEIKHSMVNAALAGDYRTQKLILEMTGEYTGVQAQSNVNFQALIMRLVEVVQKHVTDPVALSNIAKEISEITSESGSSFGTGPVVRGEISGT